LYIVYLNIAELIWRVGPLSLCLEAGCVETKISYGSRTEGVEAQEAKSQKEAKEEKAGS
jgi:hypothetical protein